MGCKASSKSDTITPRPKISDKDQLKITPASFVLQNSSPFFSKYRIGSTLGSGAYGQVYRCIEKKTGRIRALKIFRICLMEKETDPNDLLREIEILKTLDHPNIVKVYEHFQDAKRIYIVMELCKGGELFNKLIKARNFTEGQAAQYMQQILRAVAYLHDRGVVHRDLKPENILLDDDTATSIIKLGDFGSAVNKNPNSLITGALGSLHYVAPEVLMNQYDEKCDLWSCGVILYAMLSGSPPFYGKDDKAVLRKIKAMEYDFHQAIWSNISNEAKDLITKLLCSNQSRLSAIEALNHAWISEQNQNRDFDHQIIDQALGNLSKFHCKNKLRDAVFTFITSQCITSQDIKELRDAFTQMDINGDGKLSRDELYQHYLQEMAPEQAEEEAARIMEEVDTDKSGFIDYTEFLKAALDSHKLLCRNNLKEAFEIFDRDGNGSISLDELRKILSNGLPSQDTVWQEIISEIDDNRDGEIDLKEFEALILDKI